MRGGFDDPDATRRLGGIGAHHGGGEAGGVSELTGVTLARRYQIGELLGAGQAAELYRAVDYQTNRPVLVKLYRPATDPRAEADFLEGARLLANLSHPGLLPVRQFGQERGRVYLVMDHLEAPTLRGVINQRRPSDGELSRIGARIAEVLDYLHEQGVVHREVTPTNIVLGGGDSPGQPRLADLGVPALAGEAGRGGYPPVSAYWAPEQVRGEPAGPPADVFALGLVLLEAVTGQPAYPGDERSAAAARLHNPPVVPNDLAAPLANALLAMTELSPGARPSAARAAAMLSGAPAVSAAAPVEGSSGPGMGKMAAIGLPVLVLLGLLGVLLFTGDDDDSSAGSTSASATASRTAAHTATRTATPTTRATTSRRTASPSAEASRPGLPDLPSISDLPKPDVPSGMTDKMKQAWDDFTGWLSGLF